VDIFYRDFQSMDGLVVRQHHAQKSALPSDSSGGLNMERKRRRIRYTIFPSSSNKLQEGV